MERVKAAWMLTLEREENPWTKVEEMDKREEQTVEWREE